MMLQVNRREKGTADPDGDEVTYHWFHYSEAERDIANERADFDVQIKGAKESEVELAVPRKLPRGADKIHIILDVEDNGSPSLHAYRRVVLKVQD